MPTFRFNKLVRDGIVSQMQQKGDQPHWRHLGHTEIVDACFNKLTEEVAELRLDSELVNELADVQELLQCLAREVGISQQKIKIAQRQKRLAAGSFRQGIFIDWVVVPPHSPWLSYYLQHPDKYPQLD